MALQKRAIIIGGGIGGLAVAIALRQAGWDAQVNERASRIREVGAGLVLWANAVRALDALGVAEQIRALKPPAPSAGLYTSHGKPLLEASVEKLEQQVGEISIVVHRAELLAILRSALGEDTIHLGRSCTRVEQDAAGVQAYFEDGSMEYGDILIGADGIRSVVRAHIIGDGEPSYAGYTSYRAVTSFDHTRIRPGEYWGRGERFGIAPLSGGRVYWFATRNASAGGRETPAETLAILRETFRGWCEPIEALIATTPPDSILHHDIADRTPVRNWSNGRITLLGDAAHPMTPNLGQGGCQALEDAVVLGNSLRTHADHVVAFRSYEERRHARTRQIVRQSRRIGQIGQWSNPWLCSIRNVLVRVGAPVQDLAARRVIGYRV